MRYNTLTRNNEFIRVYRRGKSANHRHLVVYAFKKKYGGVRIGITASKKVGNAVTRNRARRVIRHALHGIDLHGIGHYDIVVVAKHSTPYLKSYDVEKIIRKQLVKLGFKEIDTV